MLFDLDDTLMAHSAAVDHAIDQAQRGAGALAASGAAGADAGGFVAFAADDPSAVRARWRELEDHHYARYLSGELDFLGQRIWRARELLSPYGVTLDDEAALRWFAEYVRGYEDGWALYDDALPALDAIERAVPGVRFGIITNGDLTIQTGKLHRIALWDRLDLTPLRADGSIDEPERSGRLVTSGELGVAKPDPAIFVAAAAAFGVSAASCLYVGDRLATDAIGAQNAGMRGVWLARPDRNLTSAAADSLVAGALSVGADPHAARATPPGTAVPNDATVPAGVTRIASLAELPALLA
ncbi:putative hydrolase [Microcella alkaliphila]|uniref:Putative hydrolase n=1 Tax=Microcella alkaliphila TaxID=279828 RepID=A0A0U5BF49_9MICO|nr:putative hydrolase [Microcella alkaliphila]